MVFLPAKLPGFYGGLKEIGLVVKGKGDRNKANGGMGASAKKVWEMELRERGLQSEHF